MRSFVVLSVSVAVCLAIASVLIAGTTEPIAPTGDTAVLESYTLQAGDGRLLVGPYSRFQWHHPGPMYFYLLAPFYAAANHRTMALNAAALVVNFTAVALMLGTMQRARAPASVLALTGGLFALYVLRVGGLLTSAWNPHIIVLPLAALAVIAAAAAAGDVWLLPVAAAAASFVAQTDVGAVPAAIFFGLAAVAGCVVAAREPTQTRRSLQAMAVTATILLVLWLPALVEQFSTTPGNIGELWRFFARGGSRGQPFKVAFSAWAAVVMAPFGPGFDLAQGRALRRTHDAVAQGWAITQMALLVLTALVCFVERRRFPAYLSSMLLVASLVALWSMMRIEGEITDHQIFWVSALAALNTAVAFGVIIEWVWTRRRAAIFIPSTALSCALLLFVAALGLSRLQEMRTTSREPRPDSVAILRSASAIQDYLARVHVNRPLIKIDQSSWGLAAGVLLQLQKAGVAYAVEDDWLPMFTDVARATGRERTILSVSGATQHVMLSGRPGVVAVAENDPVFVDALPAATVS